MMNDSDWFTRVQQLQLPAVLPLDALPPAGAPLSEWMNLIREDPLLTIHLFRYANKMLASNDVSVKTLDQAVTLLGSKRLIALSAKVLRVQADSASTKGLLRAIGDSLLAASLMRQWFEIRQIPWSEADYWMTLFYDLGLWVIWLLEPEKMESIELGVKQGKHRDALLRDLLGMEPRAWNEQLCLYFQLPVLHETVTTTSLSDSRIQAFKQSALKFFLPFSHELAFVVRQDWQSEALEALCRTGEISLGLTEFRPMLKRWVTSAAREFKLPHAALAARRLLAQQPSSTLPARNGFNDHDMALASKLSKLPDVGERPKLSNAWSATELRQRPRAAQASGRSAIDLFEATAAPSQIKRIAVDLNIQREIRRQFRNQQSWYSPSEIQESALYGLQRGLSLSRIVALEVSHGFWQAFDSEGCQQHSLLQTLKLPIHSSDILLELSKRVTALWVNPSNRHKAEKSLPPALIAAASEDHFFLRSFAIGPDITMLLYVDGFNQPESLNAVDYRLFREYCADWNTALNKMRP
ncbi:HDOD domain-containing protein [Reinekea sp.]|jgi:hypothetical protein|uniref:HDOD domain-containing protein n=1 Tax=Reinekea sp. TaxID=1970455 RepID=UPI002A80003A|nr:HDOD domain-containing protein [Reinekea sp.]